MARDLEASSISRRSFCRASVGILIAPGIVSAQASKAVRRIGVLEHGNPETPEELSRQAKPLQELGWVEGKNLHVERRYANGHPEALQALAEELVRAKVEIIVTGSTPATLAAKHATSTIPIIIKSAGDPVLLGLVASLAQPGGNVTGYSQAAPEVTAKSLSILKELLPGLQRIGALWETAHPYYRATRNQFEHTCELLGLKTIFVDYAAPAEIGGAIAQLAAHGSVQALVVQSDDFTWDYRFEVFDTAKKYGLPTIVDDDNMVRDAGALIAYTTSLVEQDRILAEYIDKILRGANPAGLPVRQPTMFKLVINLKTARALGIKIPESLLLRADEVIQ